MAKADPNKLRDKAVAASAKGKHKKALEYYQELEKLEPKDGGWSRKTGEMHRQLGQDDLAIRAFGRASARYAELGFLVKAIAACKIILRIDPGHKEAQAQLVAFNEERGISAPAAPAPVAAPVAAPAPAPAVLARDLPLEAVALHESVVGAQRRTVQGIPSGIIEIPLELDMPLEIHTPDQSEESVREALQQTPLFSALPPASLYRLIEKIRLVELAAGDTLFREGDEGTTLYVVSEGRIAVVSEGPAQAVLGELKDGDFFGEVSLITNQPRSATVRAVTDSEVLAIDRQVVGDMIAEEPAVLTVLLRFLRERLVDNLVRTSQLFAPFVGEERQGLIARFQFLEVDAKSVLVSQGEVSPALFVCMSGSLSVDRNADGESSQLATLGVGDVFGEMSLLAHGGAVASVSATTKCLVLELPARAFREIIMTHPQVLAFVGDLASDRERQLAAVAGGDEQYEELHLDLF